MGSSQGIKIMATGSYLPECVVTNEMFESIIDTSDEWIRTRTGIEQRHFANGESNFSMLKKACEDLFQGTDIKKEDIIAVLCATVTNDYMTPSLSCMVQREFGLPESILAFDIGAACSGFVYALKTAHALLQGTTGKYVLVSGSEVLSRATDFTDRSSCILFADGAGAALIGLSEENPFFFEAGAIGDDENLYGEALYPNENPFAQTKKTVQDGFLHMNGSAVFRFAVEKMAQSTQKVLERAGVKPNDIDHYVCHQANARILTSAANRLKVDPEKFYMNVSRVGNTSAASVPIVMDEMNKKGLFHRGDKILLSGFGGGLTYGSAYFIW